MNQGNGFESDNKLDSTNVPNGWKWPDSIMNPLHKAEDYWKNFNKVDKTLEIKQDWDDDKKLAQDRLLEAAKGASSTSVVGQGSGVIMAKMKNETAK